MAAVVVQVVALPLAVQVVALPLAVQVVAQRARGTPATRVVKQDLPAQRPATRVVKQERQARSGDAGSQAGAPTRSGDAGSQIGDNERFYQSVTPAASAYKRGIEASKNAPSAAPQGVFPSRHRAVPPPNAQPTPGAGTTPNARTSSGVGTTPNGRPIGSVGSGPGSPEQPH